MPEILEQPYSLALGLNRHPLHTNHPKGNPGLVERFAKKVVDTYEVLTYPDLLSRTGLPPAEVGPELEEQLLSFMQDARHIHFQLDGMLARGHGSRLQPRQVQSIRDALVRGEFGTAIPRNVTNWEFYQIWHSFREKTTFYWKRKLIDLTEILK